MRRENKAGLTVVAILLAATVILFLTVKYIVRNTPVWAGSSIQTIRTVVIDPGHAELINTKETPRLICGVFCFHGNDSLNSVHPIFDRIKEKGTVIAWNPFGAKQ